MTQVAFTCERCVYCCFFGSEDAAPIVFPWEKRLLEDLAEKHNVLVRFKPIEVYRDSNGDCAVTLYRWVIRGFCPFYRVDGSRCLIHDVKPLACRMYPLIVDMSRGRVLVSSKCRWVERNLALLQRRPDKVSTAFRAELVSASEAYMLYHDMVGVLRELGLEKIPDAGACRSLYDADKYVVEVGVVGDGEHSA